MKEKGDNSILFMKEQLILLMNKKLPRRRKRKMHTFGRLGGSHMEEDHGLSSKLAPTSSCLCQYFAPTIILSPLRQ